MYISRSCGGATFCPIKLGGLVKLVDVITPANFMEIAWRVSTPQGAKLCCFPFTEVYVLNSLPPYRAGKWYVLNSLPPYRAGKWFFIFIFFSRSRRLTKPVGRCWRLIAQTARLGLRKCFLGLESPQFKFWGSPSPQIPKICPVIGKSQPKLTCRITFKR